MYTFTSNNFMIKNEKTKYFSISNLFLLIKAALRFQSDVG